MEILPNKEQSQSARGTQLYLQSAHYVERTRPGVSVSVAAELTYSLGFLQ